MKRSIRKLAYGAVAMLAASGLAASAAQAQEKSKIFLSMSYIGNDWQAEAANMVKAMATHKSLADKVDLQVQVAGPSAQKQIQQINSMVQAGAKAIIVYPISPTALNGAVKNACAKGVIVVAYDSIISEPCAYNVHIDQRKWGVESAEWLVAKLGGKGKVVMITGVPGTTVDTLRIEGAKEVFAKNPGIEVVAEANGMWSQAVARTELSKILATRPWDQIDGLWMQAGCYTANSMQSEAGIADDKLLSLRWRVVQWRPHPDAAGRNRSRWRQWHLPSDGRTALVVRFAELHWRARAQACRRKARGQGNPGADRRCRRPS